MNGQDSSYFNSTAIGSSVLATCIQSHDQLVVCTDRATKEVKPTTFMEMGKIFEDLVEAHYSRGMDWFWEKYFKSNVSSFPSGIMEVLETENIWEAIEEVRADKKYYTKKGALSKIYERKFHVLDQIKAHDYRRPIPAPWWSKLEIMLERFGNCPLTLWEDNTMSIDEWLRHKAATVIFQQEYFWNTPNEEAEYGADCRAKFDLILLIKWHEKTFAVPFDIKCTGDEVDGNSSFGAFQRNWRTKYIWQSKHYHEGFKFWCEENGYRAYHCMPYIIQESEEPQITNVMALHPQELDALDADYHEALPIIQKWIDDGKPIVGYMPQKNVNRYGREWNE